MHLLIITNLFPLPWEPNRATFNRQQFQHLEKALGEDSSVRILIPVAWPEWLKHRKQIASFNQSHQQQRLIPYFYTPRLARRSYSVTMLLSLLLAWRWIKQAPVDQILASWAFPEGVACGWLARMLKIPYCIKVHGSDINMHCLSLPRRRQIVMAANRSQGVLAVSQALKDKMVEYGIRAENIRVIYNGVDQQQFQPSPERPLNQRTRLVFVGNLKQDKGVFELLEAFSQMADDNPELTLHYYGSGSTSDKLAQRISQLKLNTRVVLHGSVAHDQLPEIFSHARLLILPSYHEGVPNVLLEAMASGVPSVATAVGGIPEILNNDNGQLVIRTADIAALEDAMLQALDQSWHMDKIRQSAANFDWRINASLTCELLQCTAPGE